MDSKTSNAKKLAQMHFSVEPGMKQIFRLYASESKEGHQDEPVKLLEVNEFTVPTGIMPLYFGPSPASGIMFSSMILEVTPEEFEQVKSGELRLPEQWRVGEELKPEVASNGAR
ncbi:MAG TPA: hypothetical protein VM510_12135 [Caulifigura sp.]|nr:hypothetical protein [Caulifigura sp.]